MDAKFVYAIQNVYQGDATVLSKLNDATVGIIIQSAIQYIIDNLGATFVSSSSSVVSPNKIEAVIRITLSAEFIALYPTDDDKNSILRGTFQGIISTGLPCVNVKETISYIP